MDPTRGDSARLGVGDVERYGVRRQRNRATRPRARDIAGARVDVAKRAEPVRHFGFRSRAIRCASSI